MFEYQHFYLSIIGDCYTAAEKWQFGLRGLGTDGVVTNQQVAEAAAPIVQAWWQQTGAFTSPNNFEAPNTHRLTELKVAQIDLDGTYIDGTYSYSHFYLPPIAGGATKRDGQSAQQTIAATLLTAVPRGLASKGRIYLPPSWHYIPQSTDGLIPSGDASALANSVKTLINQLNALPDFGPVMVMSKGKGVPSYNATKHRVEYDYPNPGASNAVTAVRVGRVVDTQRRRRRSLPETPVVTTLA